MPVIAAIADCHMIAAAAGSHLAVASGSQCTSHTGHPGSRMCSRTADSPVVIIPAGVDIAKSRCSKATIAVGYVSLLFFRFTVNSVTLFAFFGFVHHFLDLHLG